MKSKKLLSILLTVLMLGLTLAVAAIPASASVSTIDFGNYPQTRVLETRLLRNAASAATWKSYGYIDHINDSADGKMFQSDYMKYADFVVGDVKYRAVRFTKYRSYSTCLHPVADLGGHSSQDENGYEPNTTYYFKYEPLTWRVLDFSTGMVLCDKLIDAQAYQSVVWNNATNMADGDYFTGVNSGVYANNYAQSTINKWLNEDFYNTAFNAAQKAKIKKTTTDNSAFDPSYSKYDSPATTEKIFLLSYDDMFNSDYGFSAAGTDASREARGTDYAKCQGLLVDYYGTNSEWWLRTPGSSSGNATYTAYGYLKHDNGPVFITNVGVRPACCLSNLANDTTPIPMYTASVSASPAEGGEVVGAICNEGDTATVTATPGSGYRFTGWYKDGSKVSDSAAYTFTITEDVALTAAFEKDPDSIGKEKDLNFFQRLIQWIKNFFAKLFGR